MSTEQLAAALAVTDEDRVSEADAAFDAAYEAAAQDDREWVRERARGRIEEAKQLFLVRLSVHLPVKADTIEGVLYCEVDGFKIRVDRALSFWDFPRTVEVGTVGNRPHRYRVRKDGTWNFKKIAEEVYYRLRGLAAQAAKDQRARANAGAAQEVMARTRLRRYSGPVSVSSNAYSTEAPVVLAVNIKKSMTVDAACELIEFLRSRGLVADYCFEKEGE